MESIQTSWHFLSFFFMHSPKRYLKGQNVVTFLLKHPKWDQNLQFTRPKRDYEHPQSLLYGSPPGLSLCFIVRSGWYWPSLVPFHQGIQHILGFTSYYFQATSTWVTGNRMIFSAFMNESNEMGNIWFTFIYMFVAAISLCQALR